MLIFVELGLICINISAVISVNLVVSCQQYACLMNMQLWGFHGKNLEHE